MWSGNCTVVKATQYIQMYLCNFSAKPQVAVPRARLIFWCLKWRVTWTLLRNTETLHEDIWLLSKSQFFPYKWWFKSSNLLFTGVKGNRRTWDNTNNHLFFFQPILKTLLLDFWWLDCFSQWDIELCPISSMAHGALVFCHISILFNCGSFLFFLSEIFISFIFYSSVTSVILQYQRFTPGSFKWLSYPHWS